MRRQSHWGLPLVAIALALGLTLLAMSPPLRRLELLSTDYRFNIRGERESAAKVAIISIDDSTLQQWGVPAALFADKLANIVDIAFDAGAKRVALDIPITFPADRYLRSLIGDNAPQPNYKLAQVLVEHGKNAIVGVATGNQPADDLAQILDQLSVGIVDAPHQEDEMARKLYVRKSQGNDTLYGFAAAACSGLVQLPPEETFTINYIGADVPTITALQAEQRQSTDKLKDAIVIVAAQYSVSGDVISTPFRQIDHGVIAQANGIATLLDRRELSSWPEQTAAIVSGILALLIGVACIVGKARVVVPTIIVLAAVWLVGAQWLFAQRDIVVPVAAPLLAFLLVPPILFSFRGVSEALERARMQGVFGAMVSPQVRDYVLQSAKNPTVGGAEVTATVMFVDVRGFTTRSETAEPAKLVAQLNRFFEGCIHQVNESGGLVLTFLGDGFVALFGAPKVSDAHAAQAILAARAIQNDLQAFNKSLPSNDEPWRIGIGIHTGPMLVGNVGGKGRFQYTAIGDTVNTASRLQDETKKANCTLLVSDETLRAADVAPLATFELTLPGKTETVKAHSLT